MSEPVVTLCSTATNILVHFEAILAFIYVASDSLNCDFL